MRMKLAVVLILSCMSIYAECAIFHCVGICSGTKELGSETVQVPSTVLQIKTYTFTFPKVFCTFLYFE